MSQKFNRPVFFTEIILYIHLYYDMLNVHGISANVRLSVDFLIAKNIV